MPSTLTSQNWDGVTPPALPGAPWTFDAGYTTSTTQFVSSPNSLKYTNPGNAGDAVYGTADAVGGLVQVTAKVYFTALVAAGEVQWAVVARRIDANNNYLVWVEPTGSVSAGVSLIKIVAGVSTQLGSTIGAGGIALAAWYTVRLVCNGTTLLVFLSNAAGHYLDTTGLYRTDFQAVPCIVVQDASISGSHPAGLHAFQDATQTGADAQFSDDFLFESLTDLGGIWWPPHFDRPDYRTFRPYLPWRQDYMDPTAIAIMPAIPLPVPGMDWYAPSPLPGPPPRRPHVAGTDATSYRPDITFEQNPAVLGPAIHPQTPLPRWRRWAPSWLEARVRPGRGGPLTGDTGDLDPAAGLIEGYADRTRVRQARPTPSEPTAFVSLAWLPLILPLPAAPGPVPWDAWRHRRRTDAPATTMPVLPIGPEQTAVPLFPSPEARPALWRAFRPDDGYSGYTWDAGLQPPIFAWLDVPAPLPAFDRARRAVTEGSPPGPLLALSDDAVRLAWQVTAWPRPIPPGRPQTAPAGDLPILLDYQALFSWWHQQAEPIRAGRGPRLDPGQAAGPVLLIGPGSALDWRVDPQGPHPSRWRPWRPWAQSDFQGLQYWTLNPDVLTSAWSAPAVGLPLRAARLPSPGQDGGPVLLMPDAPSFTWWTPAPDAPPRGQPVLARWLIAYDVPWYQSGAVITVGPPYYAIAGQIYFAGAVAGDVQTE